MKHSDTPTMSTSTSQRPWEMGNTAPGQQNATPKQLPSISALTSKLPDRTGGPDRTSGLSGLSSPTSTKERDSGAWSSQPQSTRE